MFLTQFLKKETQYNHRIAAAVVNNRDPTVINQCQCYQRISPVSRADCGNRNPGNRPQVSP
jgi:hypothetical protein